MPYCIPLNLITLTILTKINYVISSILVLRLTNFMKHSPWGANSCSATQEFSSILWNPTVHCGVDKSAPLILNQWVQSTYSHSISLKFVLILFSHLGDLFHSDVLTKTLYAFLFFPVHATCSTHVTVIIFGEKYELWRHSLWLFR
jgi:hypothetical protein